MEVKRRQSNNDQAFSEKRLDESQCHLEGEIEQGSIPSHLRRVSSLLKGLIRQDLESSIAERVNSQSKRD